MRQLQRKLSYSNVIATLALFIALSGGAYAATQLPKNSVGSKQLKKGAVTGAKVKKGSLSAASFKPGQLPAGAKGAAGPKGEMGPAGRSALEPLRSGETIHGTWSLSQYAEGGGFAQTSPTFPIPAPVPVNSAHVVVAGNDVETGDGCTGSAAAPVAAPGFVCIYVANSSGTDLAGGLGANGAIVDENANDGSRYGFMVFLSGPGEWLASGTWAYTAPL
jgi:hypothetical protein